MESKISSECDAHVVTLHGLLPVKPLTRFRNIVTKLTL
jgi:hypothetical protein